MTNTFDESSLKKVCRACMNTEENPVSLMENDFGIMFRNCTDLLISPDDVLPKVLCIPCSELLLTLHTFRMRCHISDTSLRQSSMDICTVQLFQLKEDVHIKSEVKLEDLTSLVEYYPDTSEHFDDDGYDVSHETIYEESKYKVKDDKKPRKLKRKKIKSENNDFKEEIDIKVPIPRYTSKMTEYFCGLCPKFQSNNFADFTNHINSHREEKHCRTCHEKSYDWADLICHRFKHLPPKKISYLCHLCEKRFPNGNVLEFHIRNTHFNQKGALCKICHKFYKNVKYLNRHVKAMHSARDDIKCKICKLRFDSVMDLLDHKKYHDENKKYICDICSYGCNIRSVFVTHMKRIHLPSRNSKCRICGKICTSKERLADHVRYHMVTNGGTRYVCTVCGLQFKVKRGLRLHTMTHTGERPHSCSYCPARFKTPTQLTNHQNRHLNHRPHKCKYCSKGFFTLSVLIKHVRVHTGVKPYVCNICNKGFTGGNNLKVHMKVHGEYLVNKKEPKVELHT